MMGEGSVAQGAAAGEETYRRFDPSPAQGLVTRRTDVQKGGHMPAQMQWSIEVKVGGGPELTLSNSFVPAAYSVVEFEVDGGESETVPVQPGAREDVQLLLISASRYADADLEYELGGETIALDAPQLFTGGGMLGFFSSDPKEITVNNDLADPVTVTILVGRTAP